MDYNVVKLEHWSDLRLNVKVTGTLQQGAARCRVSNGASRPLVATCL